MYPDEGILSQLTAIQTILNNLVLRVFRVLCDSSFWKRKDHLMVAMAFSFWFWFFGFDLLAPSVCAPVLICWPGSARLDIAKRLRLLRITRQ